MTAPDLARAVEGLYETFAQHPLAQQVSYCAHCVSDDEALILQRKRLRDLTAGDLERFTRKAMSTWGDEADFQHFLPRILELFATSEQTDGNLFVVTMRNVRYHGTSWPTDEIKAVEQYLIALWRRTLSEPDPAIRATEILDGVAQNDHTVAAYLEIWADEAGESPALHLAEFIDELGWTRSKQDTLRRESRAWLRTGVPGQILETAFFATGDSDAAAWLSHALEQLPFLAADDDV